MTPAPNQLTHEAVLAMPAGRDLDAHLATRVMRWRPSPDGDGWVTDTGLRVARGDWSPSRSIGDAWDIVEADDETGGKRWYYNLDSHICGGWDVSVHDELAAVKGENSRPPHLQRIYAATAPLAIGRAALLAVMTMTPAALDAAARAA